MTNRGKSPGRDRSRRRRDVPGTTRSAVRGLVRGHKGTLKIASAPGQGTTVTVLLPAAGRPAAPGDPEAPRAAASAAPPARWQVLIVDDEPSVRGVAARILERLGYAVLAAELGAEGLELYRAHAPAIDAVLLDLTMPQMSGEEVYQSLLRLDPDARVVIMSGYSAEDIRARFPSGARLGFLQKPFTPAALDRALREIGRA